VRRNASRFGRDIAGPGVSFYLGWKLVGLIPGVIVATTVAVVIFTWERRRGRSGLAASLGFGIAVIQAIVALASGSAIGYFAPGVIASGLYGAVFVVSVLIGRPLAGVFAGEAYPFPPEAKRSRTFRRTFTIVSLAWGLTLLARCAFRLLVLSWGNVDLFVVVDIVTGLPLSFALLVWSFWYALRRFRQSAEFGAALAARGDDR
jgi:uncharacterized protein DUF3159